MLARDIYHKSHRDLGCCFNLYHYLFRDAGSWWTREYTGEYMPVITKDDSKLVDYLKYAGILDSKVCFKFNSAA